MSEMSNQPELDQTQPTPQLYVRYIPVDQGYDTALAYRAVSLNDKTDIETPTGTSVRAYVKHVHDRGSGQSLTYGIMTETAKDEDVLENPQFYFCAGDLIISLASKRKDRHTPQFKEYLITERAGQSAYYVSADPSIMDMNQGQLEYRREAILRTSNEIVDRQQAKAAGLLGRITAIFQRPPVG